MLSLENYEMLLYHVEILLFALRGIWNSSSVFWKTIAPRLIQLYFQKLLGSSVYLQIFIKTKSKT